MSSAAFDRLHPALQHHIVNSLGWRSLRPFQEEALTPVLEGRDLLLVAPTAGGKTEAAFFPVLSRMLAENWRGLSVVYVCPIKALLNNLERRLAGYAELVGRRVELWHGDVTGSKRNRLLADPPDVLLTTPESLEVMLISRRTAGGGFLKSLRVTIVDEIHAFAGDDRGWHLLAVLERIERAAGRAVQRLGLSATVGNPEDLLTWLTGSSERPARLITPSTGGSASAEVSLDHVGTIENAALVISRLHRGEKRLVFCDSRARAERLAASLKARAVQTYVSHSSLSLDERRRSEAAFAQGTDCVIVATSTLELGLDVGDLDRVLQLDAPSSVASFLQRIGRTGRRPGTTRNCLFLAASENALLRAAGLLVLWGRGQVECVTPPPRPLHVLAQQFIAHQLECGQTARHEWRTTLGRFVATADIGESDADEVFAYLLALGYLAEQDGVLSVGVRAEQEFGGRNYMELCAVFSAPPLFQVLHGRTEIGHVHPLTFQVREDGPAVLLLGGQSWRVRSIDWKRQVARVEPADQVGRSQWLGGGPPDSYRHCQAMRDVLRGTEVPARLSERAQAGLQKLRDDFCWVEDGTTALVRGDSGSLEWWTFGGLRANAMLRELVHEHADPRRRARNLSIPMSTDLTHALFERVLREAADRQITAGLVPVSVRSVEGLKFSGCLPESTVIELLQKREADVAAVQAVLAEPCSQVEVNFEGNTPARLPTSSPE